MDKQVGQKNGIFLIKKWPQGPLQTAIARQSEQHCCNASLPQIACVNTAADATNFIIRQFLLKIFGINCGGIVLTSSGHNY